VVIKKEVIIIKYLYICCLVVLIFSLSACTGDSQNIDQTKSSSGELNSPTQGVTDKTGESTSPETTGSGDYTIHQNIKLSDLVPCLASLTNVGVKVPGFIPNYLSDGDTLSIYAPASEVQAQEIISFLELLDETEFTEVERYDRDRYRLITNTIRIENTADSCAFSLIASEDENGYLYLLLVPIQRPADILAGEDILPFRHFEGRLGTFPIRAFRDALIEVLLDTNDIQNIAVVQVHDSDDPELLLNKSLATTLRYIFDATIRINEPVENSEEHYYNVEIIIGDTTYCLNSTSGDFSRVNNGESVCSKLDDPSLQWIQMRLYQR